MRDRRRRHAPPAHNNNGENSSSSSATTTSIGTTTRADLCDEPESDGEREDDRVPDVTPDALRCVEIGHATKIIPYTSLVLVET